MPTTVKNAGNGASSTTERPRKIFLLPYAHCDNAWSHTRRWHEDRYTQIFHEVLDIMNRDPDYKWYFDTAYEELSPFARRAPERMAELRRRIQQGKIEVAPNTISNPAFDSVGGETFIRNMVYGRRYFERVFDTRTEVYTANDLTPGHSQIPQLLKKGGYRFYRFTRPSLNELVDFYWEGLDGTRILSSRGGYGYGTLADARAFPHDYAEDWPKAANVIYEEIKHRFIIVYRRGKPVAKVQIDYSTLGNAGIVWYSRGGDDCRPLRDLRGQPVDIIGLVREWNRREKVPLLFATPTEYFTELEQHDGKFPVISGVLDSSGCACRFGILGNESLFVWWFRDEIAITTAERLASIGSACLDRPYPEQRFDKLWNDLFTTTGHAIRMAFTNDYDRLLARQKRIQRQAQHLSRGTLHALAGRIRHRQTGTPIVIFNSLAWDRTDVVAAELEFAAGSTRAIALTDSADRPVPFQITRQDSHEDGTLKHVVVAFIATVGALGYATYYANRTNDRPASMAPPQAEAPTSAAPGVTIGNRYFDVVVSRGGLGSVVLKGSRTNLFAINAMAANAISYSTLDAADDFDTLGPFTGEIEQHDMRLASVERGPVHTRIVTRGAVGAHGIRKEVVIYRDLARIDCVVEIDSKGGDGVFKAKFPLAFAGTLVGHVPFGAEVVDRAREPCGTNFANASYPHSFSAERWIDYSSASRGGVALLSSPGQTGFDYDPDKNVAKHILLKTRTIPSRTCWRHISRLHEAKGLQRLRYSIYPHAGDWRRAQVHRRASEYQEPLFCIVDKRGRRAPGPTLPATDSLIQVRPDSVVMTGLYREGDRVVARLYESHGERCQAELVFPFAIAAAAETDFYGERLDGGKAVSVSAQRLSFAIAPWEVVTLFIRPAVA